MLSEIIALEHTEVSTGTKVFNWTVPKEWIIDDAFFEDSSGKRIVDYTKTTYTFWATRHRSIR